MNPNFTPIARYDNDTSIMHDSDDDNIYSSNDFCEKKYVSVIQKIFACGLIGCCLSILYYFIFEVCF